MQVLIGDAAYQTALFAIVLCVFFVSTFWVKKKYTPLSYSQELKGFAMLTIIFAHIGYALSTDNQFLYPFSILSGVAVNLFLFLSGYGLTASSMKKEESVATFYKRRLLKLFIPFWIVLFTFFVLDATVLGKTYATEFILQSFLGIFTKATMLTDFNSPLWYFSLILFYYLCFPLVFSKKWPWVSAGILYFLVWKLVQINPPFFDGVIGLYEVHLLAFPLGITVAWVLDIQNKLLQTGKTVWQKYERLFYPCSMLFLLAFIGYVAIQANVGAKAYIEEATSLVIMFAILLLFLIKKRESKLFSMFGLFSYEIYLLHWPLLLRYDVMYTNLPAWIATVLYLGIFILLGLLLQRASAFVSKKVGV